MPSLELAATIGDQPISVAELDRTAGTRLLVLKSQEYALRSRVLRREIERRLLEAEALRREVYPANLDGQLTKTRRTSSQRLGTDDTEGPDSCLVMAEYAFGSTAPAGARQSGPKLDPTWTQVDGVESLNR